VIAVSRQQQILGEKDPDAVSLANRDGRQDVQETIKNPQRRLRKACGYTFPVRAGVRCGQSRHGAVIGADGGKPGDCSYRD